jgi:hypothetical protein
VAENRMEIGVAYDDGTFVAASDPMVQINGSVTDAAHYLRITTGPGQRHDGTAGTGVVLDGGANTQIGIDVGTTSPVSRAGFIRFHNRVGGSGGLVRDAGNVVFDRLLIHDFFEPAQAAYGARTPSPPARPMSSHPQQHHLRR